METFDSKKFFLGKLYDSANKLTEDRLLYNPADLNTHCVILGMTGSGKTGLGILLLEEIARKGIPSIVIDPKGDLTNLLLHFPQMKGKDISPWLDQEAPLRAEMEMSEYADQKAEEWVKGQESWGYTDEDVRALNAVDYTVFTPGTTNGNPVNIMGSFAAPNMFWNEANDEIIREQISTSVTALLGLIGLSNIDPIKSKEHILLSNIIEFYWSMGRDVTLTDLISAISEPPFDSLGALSVDTIYPRKERMNLAMQINNFLASPSFKSWNMGPSLDLDGLIRNKDGKPRCNIFYIQHLSDQERMFFVTMLYSQVESWMRCQTGTGNLRLVVYFDEMAGYIPPSGNPSSKPVMLRLMKQARAYGVSLVLASQNPIDIDYKGLSNAGTWFVGHLQTEQDKNRLLDGLSTTEGEINRSQADKLLSALKKRSFLYMNVHESGLKVFATRWTLNFLPGPLTRSLIPMLTERHLGVPYSAEDADAAKRTAQGFSEDEDELQPIEEQTIKNRSSSEKFDPTAGGVPARLSSTYSLPEEDTKEVIAEGTILGRHPDIPSTINEYYLPIVQTTTGSEFVYVPVWLAQGKYDADRPKYGISVSGERTALVNDVNLRGTTVRWGNFKLDEAVDLKTLANIPDPNITNFQQPAAWMLDPKQIKTFEADFLAWITRDADITVLSNKDLDLHAHGEEVSRDDFSAMCQEKAETLLKKDIDKLQRSVETRLSTLQMQLNNAIDNENELELKARGNDLPVLGGILNFANRKQLSSAQSRLNRAQQKTDELNKKIEDVQNKLESDIEEQRELWNDKAEKIDVLRLSLNQREIYTECFGICWVPCCRDENGRLVSVSAYQA